MMMMITVQRPKLLNEAPSLPKLMTLGVTGNKYGCQETLNGKITQANSSEVRKRAPKQRDVPDNLETTLRVESKTTNFCKLIFSH